MMKIGDIFVLKKEDILEADLLRSDVEKVMRMGVERVSHPRPAVTVSVLNDEGIDGLMDSIDEYLATMRSNGTLMCKRKKHLTKR